MVAPVAGEVVAPAEARRERVRAMMRDEVLTAARQIVQDQGVKGLAMRTLAQAVGVTAPTLYDYFPSKEAVLDALYIQGASLMLAEFQAAIDGSEPGRPRLQAIGSAYRRFALSHPDLYLLMYGRVDASYRPGVDEMACGMDVQQATVGAVAEAIALGHLRPGDPEAVAHVLWTLAHGHVSLEINGFLTGKCHNGDAAGLYDRNFALLFAGLIPPTADAGAAVGAEFERESDSATSPRGKTGAEGPV